MEERLNEELQKGDKLNFNSVVDILEEDGSMLFKLSFEELNQLYIVSTKKTKYKRIGLVKLIADAYSDNPNATKASLGSLKLLEFGNIYNQCKQRDRVSLAATVLSLVNSDLPDPFLSTELLSRDDEDKFLWDEIQSLVQNLSPNEQAKYLEFASEEVKLERYSCCKHIADNSYFGPEDTPKITVLVLGEAGAGKSTLTNEAFKNDLPEEQKSEEGVGGHSLTSEMIEREVTYTRPINEKERELGREDGYIDVIVSLIDAPGLTREEMEKQSNMIDLSNSIMSRINDGLVGRKSPIDVVLWVVPGSTSRLPTMDEFLIRSIGLLVPVCLVWTRAIFSNHIKEFKDWIENRSEVKVALPLCGMYEVYAREEECRGKIQPSFGMPQLGIGIAKIANNESREMRGQYQIKTKNWTEKDFKKRRDMSYRYVKQHTALAGLCGATPIPYLDTFAVFSNLSAMVIRINSAYGASLPRNIVSSLLCTVITGSSAFSVTGGLYLVGALVVDVLGDTLKLIPGLNILGTMISVASAGCITAAVGCAFVSGVEKISRANPYILDVPQGEIEAALLKEAETQAKQGLTNATNRLSELLEGDEE